MTKEKLIQILDKNIDQQGIEKDLAVELVIPELEKLKQKVLSKEIDLIKSTSLENEAIAKVIDGLILKLQGL